jgi:hypothetical protein
MSPVAGHAATTEPPPNDFTVEGPAFAQLRGISVAEADQRLGWQQVAPALWQNLSADIPTRFGGVWIGVTNGDRVEVGITGGIDATITAVVGREAAAVGLNSYDLVPVARTEATLVSDMTWLAGLLAKVNPGAPAALGAGERTDLNQLQLDLPASGQLTSAQTSAITDARARLGAELVVTGNGQIFSELSCVYPFCDPPLRGGVEIIVPNVKACTLGFIAQSRVDTKEYAFTAGHCGIDTAGPWHTNFTDGSDHVIGDTWHAILSTERGDESIIAINNVPGWNPQARVNVTASAFTTSDPKYFIKATGWSVVGQRICTTGAFSGASTCGTVTELDFSYEAEGFEFDHAGLTDICATHGDSGAPMYASHIALGILVAGSDDCDTAYDGIRNAESRLNVNVITTTS